jgi:hypothetical protein
MMMAPADIGDIPKELNAYIGAYNQLADEALRAGVVVNFFDMDELYNKARRPTWPGMNARYNFSPGTVFYGCMTTAIARFALVQ